MKYQNGYTTINFPDPSRISRKMIEAGMKARYGDDVYDDWRDDDIERMENIIREILEASLAAMEK